MAGYFGNSQGHGWGGLAQGRYEQLSECLSLLPSNSLVMLNGWPRMLCWMLLDDDIHKSRMTHSPCFPEHFVFIDVLLLRGRLSCFSVAFLRSYIIYTDSLEKTLMLGKIEGKRRRGRQKMRWLNGITDSVNMSWVNSGIWWWTGKNGMLQSMGSQRVGHDWVTELS